MCQVSQQDAGEGRVSSARRALDLMLCFTRDRHTLTSRELADLTGIALPSLYRYLNVLKQAGLLVADRHGGFHLSVRVVGLAEAAEAADPLIELADPVMRRLADETGETVLLVKAIGDAAMCVHRIESPHRLRTSYEPGQPVPLAHGASAHILVGSMSAAMRQSVIDRVAEADPEAAEQLRHEVELAAARGWATSSGEVDTGIWATAAAVTDRDGRVLAALSLPTPQNRAPDEARGRILQQVVSAAERLTKVIAEVER
jgi:DNA-binding IclR family transcriptional regulator